MIIHIRAGVEKATLDLLQAAADRDHRSLANLAGKILTDYVRVVESDARSLQSQEVGR